MLYQSLKQSIIQYDKRKKQTQNLGDKKVFTWKVLALGFCILGIVIIGILSQLIQSHDQNPSQHYNLTFLPQLLQQSTQLNQITRIKNLLRGMNAASKITFDTVSWVYISSQIKPTQLLTKIDKKKNILFLLTLKDQSDQTIKNFGMLLKRQYDSSIDPIQNVISIHDSKDDLNSVFFNLNRDKSMRMNADSSCRLYAFNQTSKRLSILELLHLNGQSENVEDHSVVKFQMGKHSCFGGNQTQALMRVKDLTGITLQNQKEVKTLRIQKVEVFHLTLNGEQVQ